MNTIFHLLETYKYLILLPITVVEGPIVTVIASFLASLGFLNVFIVYGVSVAGDVIGDIGWYWLGRLGRHTIIPRFGHYFGITEERLLYAEEHYKNHLVKTIFFGKFTDVPNLAILITAGATKTDFRKYLSFVLLAEIIKQPIFVVIGYYFGQSYVSIQKIFNNVYKAVAVVLAAVIIFFIIYRYVAKRLHAKSSPQ
jgi:membrane protein DedA with SNARE-associated domain